VWTGVVSAMLWLCSLDRGLPREFSELLPGSFFFFFFEKKTLRTDIFVPSFYINMILVNIIIIISPLFVKSILLIKDIYPGGIRP
jgi:hypothetical protein